MHNPKRNAVVSGVPEDRILTPDVVARLLAEHAATTITRVEASSVEASTPSHPSRSSRRARR